MMASTTTIERLREVQHRVRQQHTLVAADMLQKLIYDLEHGVIVEPAPVHRATRKPVPHSNGKAVCPFGWKYTKAGKVRNRKHECRPACNWTPEECLHWLDVTPLPGSGKLMVRRGMDFCLCHLPMSAHFETVSNGNGGIKGLRETKCEFSGRETRVPSL